MKKIILFLLIVVISVVFMIPTPKAIAAGSCPTGQIWSDAKGACIYSASINCKDNNYFKSYINPGTCLDTYDKWLLEVWSWAMRILIPLSVLILTGAGVLYMTSEGDSNRVGIAKKMIIGVVSGIGLLILGRLFLVLILGDSGANLWKF